MRHQAKAREVFAIELAALKNGRERFEASFDTAVDLIVANAKREPVGSGGLAGFSEIEKHVIIATAFGRKPSKCESEERRSAELPLRRQLMKMKTLTVAIVLIAVLAPMKAKAQSANAPLPAEKLKFSISRKVEMPYLYYLPKDYRAKGKQRWPLMLFLHGAGERGTNVQRVAIHGPMSLVKQGRDFPFIIVAPLCPEGQRWQVDSLLKLLATVTKQYAVDTNRVYLTGLSMGGYGTWNLGATRPDLFAAMAPICGGGELIDVLLAGYGKPANPIARLPVWAFHGAKDNVVPPEESERMIGAMKKAGAKEVKLTVYPEANHNSWTETYNNPALYEWFLQHELPR